MWHPVHSELTSSLSSLSPGSSVPSTTELGPKTCRFCWYQSLQGEDLTKSNISCLENTLSTKHSLSAAVPTRSLSIWNLINQTRPGTLNEQTPTFYLTSFQNKSWISYLLSYNNKNSDNLYKLFVLYCD